MAATSKDWREATSKRLCPICGRARQCKTSPDADEVVCYRAAVTPNGWQRVQRVGGGGTFMRLAIQQPPAQGAAS